MLDLDETLVHSTFVPCKNADHIVNINDEHGSCQIFVRYRPGAREFLEYMTKYYEVCIFTASMSSYASVVIDELDKNRYQFYKFYREHCRYSKENNLYIKDLSRLGRDLKDVIIVDNIPQSYCIQPLNGLPITSWIDDSRDRELHKLTPILIKLSQTNDVRTIIGQIVQRNQLNIQRCQILI